MKGVFEGNILNQKHPNSCQSQVSASLFSLYPWTDTEEFSSLGKSSFTVTEMWSLVEHNTLLIAEVGNTILFRACCVISHCLFQGKNSFLIDNIEYKRPWAKLCQVGLC